MARKQSSIEMYRDCLRLIKHIAGRSSSKALALKAIVSTEFRRNRHESDPARIKVLQDKVAKGLSNYVVFEHSKQDPKIAAHAHRTSRFVDDEHGNLVAIDASSEQGRLK